MSVPDRSPNAQEGSLLHSNTVEIERLEALQRRQATQDCVLLTRGVVNKGSMPKSVRVDFVLLSSA
jgi:hypothetical protein